MTLPNNVRADEITAAFEQSVLTVSIPRVATAQPKRIPVTLGRPSSGQTVIDAKG